MVANLENGSFESSEQSRLELELDMGFSASFTHNAHLLRANYFKRFPEIEGHQAALDEGISEERLLTFNEQVTRLLYSSALYDKIKDEAYDEITAASEARISMLLQDKYRLLDEINFERIALLSVKPDTLFMADDILASLADWGYEVFSSGDRVVDFDRYWGMYNHGFVRQDAVVDFPTRTLLYISGPSRIFVLKNSLIDQPQAFLNDNLKGKHGRLKAGTLRGDLIYHRMQDVSQLNPHLYFHATDPLGVYRAIIEGRIPTEDPFGEMDDPYLYYAGGGIHTPETDEMYRDAGLLLSPRRLVEIIKDQKRSA